MRVKGRVGHLLKVMQFNGMRQSKSSVCEISWKRRVIKVILWQYDTPSLPDVRLPSGTKEERGLADDAIIASDESRRSIWVEFEQHNTGNNSNYASSSSGEVYRDRQLTTNFEFWVEIFHVQTCFHVRIPKPCLSVRLSLRLSVPRERKSP